MAKISHQKPGPKVSPDFLVEKLSGLIIPCVTKATSARHPVILESDNLAGIDRETTSTANTLFKQKKKKPKRYETRIRSEGGVPLTKPKPQFH